jgi:hypothetical protein
MSKRIEDYGLIGNLVSAALVSRDGRSIGCACRASTRPPASPRYLAVQSMAAG